MDKSGRASAKREADLYGMFEKVTDEKREERCRDKFGDKLEAFHGRKEEEDEQQVSCKSGRQLDSQRAQRQGFLEERGFHLSVSLSRSGARVTTNAFVRDMDLAEYNALDGRRLEIVRQNKICAERENVEGYDRARTCQGLDDKMLAINTESRVKKYGPRKQFGRRPVDSQESLLVRRKLNGKVEEADGG